MADFEVKVRNLKTGETLVASMADAEQCIAWLEERPPFMEILTVLSDVSPAESRRMKEAMRPYDAAERALKAKFDAEKEADLQRRYQDEISRIERGEFDGGDEDADPNRPLAVKYEVDTGFTVVDDSRPLTDEARAACLAWVQERNAWVEGLGQLVGAAHLEGWPNEVPDGEDRVLEGGRFFPRLETEA